MMFQLTKESVKKIKNDKTNPRKCFLENMKVKGVEEIAKKVLGIYKTYDIPRQKESIEEEPCNNPDFPRRLVLDTSYTRKELGIEKFTDVDEAIKIHVLRIKAPECL